MKQFYGFFMLCMLYTNISIYTQAQTPSKTSAVEGSIWINPYLRSSEVGSEKVPILLKKIAEDKYQLSNTIGGVELYTILAFEKGCESELSCGESFNENCELICNNDCSFVNALTGQPEKMPLVHHNEPDFPNNPCFKKIATTHWYSFKTLEFANDVLGFNDIGINNTNAVYARYSPAGHWGNSNADDFGVTMNTTAAYWTDAICHEWGHYLNNRITQGIIADNNGGIEVLAIEEGLGDIWSSLVRLYLETGEDIETFKSATPDYRMWAVNRNAAFTYKPYMTCSVLDTNFPAPFKAQAWTVGDEHIKGMTLGHWFYLLSEGTSGETRTVRIQTPENESNILTTGMCNNSNIETTEKNLQFNLEGIGHWNSMQIVYRALSIIGGDERFQPVNFSNLRCATEQATRELFPNDCEILKEVGTAWYAMNIGESYDFEMETVVNLCEGDTWTVSLQNDLLENVELYAPNGELLASESNAINFEMESISIAAMGSYQLQYILKNNCDTSNDNACTFTKTIALQLEGMPKILTVPLMQTVCPSESITMNAADYVSAETIEWRTSNGELIGGEAILTFEATENTVLHLIGGNDCGTIELEAHINMRELPVILAEIPTQTTCETEMIELNASDFIQAESYQWLNSNGEIISENAMLSFEANETTELQLVGSNDCGASELTANIEVHSLPTGAEILMQANGCQSETVTLWVDGLYETYVWNVAGNDGNNSLEVTEAGNYELTLSNEQGCSQTLSIEVGEEDLPSLAVDFATGYSLVGDEVWTEKTMRVRGKLHIPSGRTLEIEGIEVEFLDDASGIVVEKGAILKINNAVLRGNACENRAWSGILAKGDAYKLQSEVQHQAQIQLTNTTIQDAYIGVEMGEGYSDAFLATGGGILQASNVSFVNNSVGVLFHAYLNESESRIAENCSFVFDAPFKSSHHLGDLGYIGILAVNIGGIEVKSSQFRNEQNIGGEAIEQGGVGIVSWHAPMRIGTGNLEEANEFSNLYRGIEAYSTSAILGYLLIEGNRFDGVAKGIHLQNNPFSSIVGNRFENMQAKNGYGVYVQETQGLTVANNLFEVAGEATQEAPIWGMIVDDSGAYGCTVYNNEFVKRGMEDKFFAAIQFEGNENPNVLIDCNRFEPISYYDLLLLDDGKKHFAEEGGCDEFDPLINPLKNQWHGACDNVETYNMYHENEEVDINWTFVPGFAPNCYSNNVQPIVCEDDDNDCLLGGFGQLSGKDEEDLLDKLETAITSQERALATSQMVRYHLKTKEVSTAIRTLQQDRQTTAASSILPQQLANSRAIPAFSRTILAKEAQPKIPQRDAQNFSFARQHRSPIFTNSSNQKLIRSASVHFQMENRQVKVKFDRSLNDFEDIDVIAIVADMNGRVVHHEQIFGQESEYQLDKELFIGEKYVCSVWANGQLIQSQKFSLVK